MRQVSVESLGAGAHKVTVDESGSSTTHSVTVDPAAAERLDVSPQRLVEASFEFLLDREPKESILASFDIEIIPRYFPDYPDRIGDYL